MPPCPKIAFIAVNPYRQASLFALTGMAVNSTDRHTSGRSRNIPNSPPRLTMKRILEAVADDRRLLERLLHRHAELDHVEEVLELRLRLRVGDKGHVEPRGLRHLSEPKVETFQPVDEACVTGKPIRARWKIRSTVSPLLRGE